MQCSNTYFFNQILSPSLENLTPLLEQGDNEIHPNYYLAFKKEMNMIRNEMAQCINFIQKARNELPQQVIENNPNYNIQERNVNRLNIDKEMSQNLSFSTFSNRIRNPESENFNLTNRYNQSLENTSNRYQFSKRIQNSEWESPIHSLSESIDEEMYYPAETPKVRKDMKYHDIIMETPSQDSYSIKRSRRTHPQMIKENYIEEQEYPKTSQFKYSKQHEGIPFNKSHKHSSYIDSESNFQYEEDENIPIVSRNIKKSQVSFSNPLNTNNNQYNQYNQPMRYEDYKYIRKRKFNEIESNEEYPLNRKVIQNVSNYQSNPNFNPNSNLVNKFTEVIDSENNNSFISTESTEANNSNPLNVQKEQEEQKEQEDQEIQKKQLEEFPQINKSQYNSLQNTILRQENVIQIITKQPLIQMTEYLDGKPIKSSRDIICYISNCEKKGKRKCESLQMKGHCFKDIELDGAYWVCNNHYSNDWNHFKKQLEHQKKFENGDINQDLCCVEGCMNTNLIRFFDKKYGNNAPKFKRDYLPNGKNAMCLSCFEKMDPRGLTKKSQDVRPSMKSKNNNSQQISSIPNKISNENTERDSNNPSQTQIQAQSQSQIEFQSIPAEESNNSIQPSNTSISDSTIIHNQISDK